MPIPDRIITELSRPALGAHLTTGDGGLVVQGNFLRSAWWKLVAMATYVVSEMLLKKM